MNLPSKRGARAHTPNPMAQRVQRFQDPYGSLAREVISSSYRHWLNPKTIGKKSGKMTATRNIEDARQFLTTDNDDLRLWAAAADRDADQIIYHARRIERDPVLRKQVIKALTHGG